jgi:hypothetical protein
VRLNRLSNLMTLIAIVEVSVFFGMALNQWSHSYRVQRDWACIFGSDWASRRTCWR